MPVDPTSVAVVVPTYNERENIEALVDAVTRHGYQVMVVDDGSPDGTGAIADGLAETIPSVSVVHRRVKEGLGPAYAHGFREALARGAEIICEMDADFSHDPKSLPALVRAVDTGADLAIGSRYVEGGSTPDWPLARRILSRGGNMYAKWMLRLAINDATAGFRAYKAGAVSRLGADTCLASGYAFQVEMAWRASKQGMVIEEVPITFRDRTAGTSKMGLRIVLEAMWLVTKWGLSQRFTRR